MAGPAAALWLAGCAAPQIPAPPASSTPPVQAWSGRLSLRVDSEPPQSFAALFALRGSAQRGELELSTPIGSTLGLLQWEPGRALLREGARVQQDDSIDRLLTRLTGAALPVHALFDWLAGRPTLVPGWQPQLERVGEGRLEAMRESPAPAAELRLIFEPAS